MNEQTTLYAVVDPGTDRGLVNDAAIVTDTYTEVRGLRWLPLTATED